MIFRSLQKIRHFSTIKTDLSSDLMVSLSMGYDSIEPTNQKELVQMLVKKNILQTQSVINTFSKLDRGFFVTEQGKQTIRAKDLYLNKPLYLGEQQNMTDPLTQAICLENIFKQIKTELISNQQKQLDILDVGTGIGYMAFSMYDFCDQFIQNDNLLKIRIHAIDAQPIFNGIAQNLFNQLKIGQYLSSNDKLDLQFSTCSFSNLPQQKYDFINFGFGINESVVQQTITQYLKNVNSIILAPIYDQDHEQDLTIVNGNQKRYLISQINFKFNQNRKSRYKQHYSLQQ